MVEEQSAWMKISCQQTKIFREQVIDPIYASMPADEATKVIAAIWRCQDRESYKNTTTETQMQKDHKYETEFASKCYLTVTTEQMYSGYNERARFLEVENTIMKQAFVIVREIQYTGYMRLGILERTCKPLFSA